MAREQMQEEKEGSPWVGCKSLGQKQEHLGGWNRRDAERQNEETKA